MKDKKEKYCHQFNITNLIKFKFPQEIYQYFMYLYIIPTDFYPSSCIYNIIYQYIYSSICTIVIFMSAAISQIQNIKKFRLFIVY